MTRAFTHWHDSGGSDGWRHHKAETRARMGSLSSGDQPFVWRVPEGSEKTVLDATNIYAMRMERLSLQPQRIITREDIDLLAHAALVERAFPHDLKHLLNVVKQSFSLQHSTEMSQIALHLQLPLLFRCVDWSRATISLTWRE